MDASLEREITAAQRWRILACLHLPEASALAEGSCLAVFERDHNQSSSLR